MAEKKSFEDRFQEIGAIWVTDKGALSFKLKDGVAIESGSKIVAFSNKFKEEGDQRPDYRLFRDTGE